MLSRVPQRVLVFLTVAALLANAYAVFTPSSGPPLPIPQIDKVVHFAIFAAPTLLGLLARASRRGFVAGMLTYAALTEVIQGLFLSTRSGSGFDLLADALGIAVATWIAGRLARHTGG